MSTIDTREIATKWRYESALIKKPKLEEACNTIADLCQEVSRLQRELNDAERDIERHKLASQQFISECEALARKYRTY